MRTVIMSIASLRIQTHLFTYKKKKKTMTWYVMVLS
jgi:hypothetical protein